MHVFVCERKISLRTSIYNTAEDVLQCCYTTMYFFKLLCQLYKEAIHTKYMYKEVF